MTTEFPLKKTAALRQARLAVPPARYAGPAHFVVTLPPALQEGGGAPGELVVRTYLEAQHARSLAIARLALAMMGLAQVPLSAADGGTVETLMQVALERAGKIGLAEDPTPFWQIKLR